jgi:hypothetical protein
LTSETITSSDLIDLVLDSNTTVMEIADIPSSGASCIIMVHGGEWVRAEWYGDVEGDCWALQRWPLYPKCEGPVKKDVVIRWLKG